MAPSATATYTFPEIQPYQNPEVTQATEEEIANALQNITITTPDTTMITPPDSPSNIEDNLNTSFATPDNAPTTTLTSPPPITRPHPREAYNRYSGTINDYENGRMQGSRLPPRNLTHIFNRLRNEGN